MIDKSNIRKEDKALFVDNQMIYRYYRERLINLALSQFEWHGLPETCDRLFFERALLYNGTAAFIKPEGTDFWLSVGYVLQGDLNVYGYPTKIRGVGFGNKANIIPEEGQWEFLYDNMTRTSLLPKIDMYARLLWECHQTFRSNLQQQITPYIISASGQDAKLGLRNLFNNIFGFRRVIELRSNFDPDQIKTIDTHADFHGIEMLDCLKALWAEALSMLGITAETTKKERLLNNEITLDRQEDLISLNSRLLNRVEFANKMNKKYGFDLTVNLSSKDFSLVPYQGDYAMQTLDKMDVRNTSFNYGGSKEE